MGKLYDEEFIKLETENYNILNKTFNIRLKQEQNQKAIECLKEVKEKSFGLREGILIFDNPQMQVIFNNIDNKIKELEEGK